MDDVSGIGPETDDRETGYDFRYAGARVGFVGEALF